MFIRALSALIGVSTLIATWYFFANKGLVYVCSIITFIACCEFSFMVEKHSRMVKSLFVILSYSFFLVFTFYSQSFLTFMSFFILLVAYFILCNHESIAIRVAKLTSWTVGLLYAGAFTGTVTVAVLNYGGSYFVALLILSFCTDSFAYLGGRAYGRHPLTPKISPKKTVEGAGVGLIVGSLIGYWYLSGLNHSSPSWVIALTCLSASLFSQVGDLFESTIKRYSGVKDSGKLLPGHGGVLDRIDGLLFAAPVVYIWMQAYI